MGLAENIKLVRENKGFKQIEVATHIGVDKSAYSKIEKGLRAITVEELQKMAKLFELTIDEVIHYDETLVPREITIEDKPDLEKLNLINQLDEEDKSMIFRMVDKMLSNKKFKDFFQKNLILIVFLLNLLNTNSQSLLEHYESSEKYLEKGDFKNALKQIDLAFKIDSNDIDLYVLKAQIYMASIESDKAYEVHKLAVKKFPTNYNAYHYRGIFFLNVSEPDLAIEDFKQAMKLASNDTIKFLNLANIGMAYIIKQDYEKAYEVNMECYKFNPNELTPLTNLGSICSTLGRDEEALKYLLRANKIAPGYEPPYTNIGYIYQSQNNHQKAIEYFNKTLELNPNEPYAYSNRSFSYLKLGNLKSAMKDIEKSIQLNSDNAYAFKNRALIYLEMKDVKKACADIETAIEKGFVRFFGNEILDLKAQNCTK
jgi:tetratricopeptide (TPR) repeat protein